MTTKREWLKKLKALKKEPRILFPNEFDELILLLGGSTRPNHRPTKAICNIKYRHLSQYAIASIVFYFLRNTERVKQLENELQELENLNCVGNETESDSFTTGCANAERIALESKSDEIENLRIRIENLRQWSAKSRAEAERMAVKWFESNEGVQVSLKRIRNELYELKQRAGLKRLGLNEYKELHVKNKKF